VAANTPPATAAAPAARIAINLPASVRGANGMEIAHDNNSDRLRMADPPLRYVFRIGGRSKIN
jgi:hypothetical protein